MLSNVSLIQNLACPKYSLTTCKMLSKLKIGIRIENKVLKTDSITIMKIISPLVIFGEDRKPNKKLKIIAVRK